MERKSERVLARHNAGGGALARDARTTSPLETDHAEASTPEMYHCARLIMVDTCAGK